MNIRFGNFLLFSIFCVSIFLFAAFSVSSFYIFSTTDKTDVTTSVKRHPTWFSNNQNTSTIRSLFWCLGGIFVLDLLVITSFGIRKLYRQTHSLEIFFFTLFLYSLCFESFRAGTVISLLLNTPIYVGVVFSRIVYFGRFFGLLSILFSSLYTVPMRYPNYTVLLLINILVSFSFAASIPIDSTIFLTTVLYKLGEENGMLFVTYSLGILSILTYLCSSVLHGNARFIVTATAVFMLFAGKEILSNMVEPYLVVTGLLLIFLGKLFFFRQMERILIWNGSFSITHGK